jgi:multimeric flavodoxin WrbA
MSREARKISKAGLVVGTSRGDGNTWKVLQAANQALELPVFDLSELRISYFDYKSENLSDDFIPTVEKLIQLETIGLISPVYWYSVSAQMKTFFDRFSDLLGPRKDLGRQLRGKRVFAMATGYSEEELSEGMSQMIKLTVEYLGMKYEGFHYTRVTEDLVISDDALSKARKFLEAKVR